MHWVTLVMIVEHLNKHFEKWEFTTLFWVSLPHCQKPWNWRHPLDILLSWNWYNFESHWEVIEREKNKVLKAMTTFFCVRASLIKNALRHLHNHRILIREYYRDKQHITNNNPDTHSLNKLLVILNQQTKEITCLITKTLW